MINDPIIDEIRRERQEHAERFDNDLRRICTELRRQERESDRLFISLPPRWVETA
jgi:hypothetical protein